VRWKVEGGRWKVNSLLNPKEIYGEGALMNKVIKV
jgi:hypothetical protein